MDLLWDFPDFDEHELVHFITDRESGLKAEMAGMDRDHRPEARLPVGDEMHELMLVEIGKIPKRVHSVDPVLVSSGAENGATNGT